MSTAEIEILMGYSLSGKEIFQIHSIMKSKQCCKIWSGCVFTKSVSLLECHFDENIWKEMWIEICKFYNYANPQMPSKISDIQIKFKDMSDKYNEDNVFILGEVPRVKFNDLFLKNIQSSLHILFQFLLQELIETCA